MHSFLYSPGQNSRDKISLKPSLVTTNGRMHASNGLFTILLVFPKSQCAFIKPHAFIVDEFFFNRLCYKII